MPTQPPSGPPDGNVLLTIGQHMATISSQLEINSRKSEGNRHKLDRLGWHVTQNTLRLADMHQSLISALQSLKTFTKTEPTSTSSTLTGRGPAPKRVSLWQRTAKFLPKVLAWLAEKALQYLAPTLLSFGLAAWALVRRSGEAVWDWVAAYWHWLLAERR
jgi:hypothetical protein